MLKNHSKLKVMSTALKIVRDERSEDFILKICKELESIHELLEKDGKTLNVMNRLKDLEFDLLVYSRMLPVRIQDIYPEVKLKKILSVLNDFDNFSQLFADTFTFYLSGDVLKLPELIRKKLIIN